MSDWIEHNGKRYYEESYLVLANNNTERARKEIELLRGTIAADDERLRTAGARVGIDQGCDTAEWMADEIERLRADVAARMPDPVPANDPELHELYDVWKGQR